MNSPISTPTPAAAAVVVPLSDVLAACDVLLQPQLFKDYGPNGLQVQGKREVRHLVTGVTASLALLEAAAAAQADAVLVHHGLFWRGQTGCITGWMHQRLKVLMAHDINLLAYHLPLDAHPEHGNNARLGALLGLEPLAEGRTRFGEQNLGWLGTCLPQTLGELARQAEQALGRSVVCVGDVTRPVRTVAWCTGGAQSYFEAAIAEGVDVFLTGELSEPQAHYARESGVGYLACGHHATERYGVQAVGQYLAGTLGLRHTHIDIDNPA
ncbi:MAG TPA: Nif3-like dinuclear metal center hexameric protein [Burkholderiaceae bacterium]|nr:Nif3-like dinuclear metal center hexameric protein [Burkholderiaceae bacterium]